MPKINVYLPDELAQAVREAQLPVSAVCQAALERAVRDVASIRATEQPPAPDATGMGLFARFTGRARTAVGLATEAARAVPHDYVGTEHLVLGLLDEGGNLALKVLGSLDVELEDLRAELVASMPKPTTRVEGHIPFTSRAKRVLELTVREALGMGHNYVGCEHILLGVLAQEDGVGGQVLRRMGLELRTTRMAVVNALTAYVRDAQADVATATATAPASGDGDGDTLAAILRRLEAIERRLGE